MSPTIVLATMLLTSHRTLPTGEARTTDLTVSMVWEKRHEGWRVIQTYESVVR
jgi:ketosteroid isomerase-like protein